MHWQIYFYTYENRKLLETNKSPENGRKNKGICEKKRLTKNVKWQMRKAAKKESKGSKVGNHRSRNFVHERKYIRWARGRKLRKRRKNEWNGRKIRRNLELWKERKQEFGGHKTKK